MTRGFGKGLVVGKFCPLHRGHEGLIRHALQECHSVVVLSYTNPELPRCGPGRRSHWLRSLFPKVDAIVLDADAVPRNDAAPHVHRRFVSEVLARAGHRVDAVFSSEDYGEPLSRVLRAAQGSPVAHVMVDRARRRVPTSGTRLREGGPYEGLLSPVVAADVVVRIAMVGGESTGKTTLASSVARRIGEPWVAEYGRELWTERAGDLRFDDLLAIAQRQVHREERAALRSRRMLVCDTSPLTTLFYSLEMFGRAEPALESLSRRPYDLAVLCLPDFDFVQDGTRRDAAFRERGHAWHRAALARGRTPWIEVAGAPEQRVQRVVHELATRLP